MNTADLEKLLREAIAGGEKENSAATVPLRLDEPRRAALLEKLRTGDKSAAQAKEEFLKKQKTAGANVIPWKIFFRKNIGALAACAACAIIGAGVGILDCLWVRDSVVYSSSEPTEFTAVFGEAGSYSHEIELPPPRATVPATESEFFEKESLFSRIEQNERDAERPRENTRKPVMQSNKLAVKGAKTNAALPDMPPPTSASAPMQHAPRATLPASSAGEKLVSKKIQYPKANLSETPVPIVIDNLEGKQSGTMPADGFGEFGIGAGVDISGKIEEGNVEEPKDISGALPAFPQESGTGKLGRNDGQIVASSVTGALGLSDSTNNYSGATDVNAGAAAPVTISSGKISGSGELRSEISDTKTERKTPDDSHQKELKKLEKDGEITKEEAAELGEQIKAPSGGKSEVGAPAPADPRPEILAGENPFSTFSLNVSDASFRLAGEALRQGRWPERESLRTEEFVNAVRYNDAPPVPGEAVALTQEQARAPFAHNRNLLRLSVQTASAGRDARQPLNITVLLDTSGSMERADRQATLKVALDALAGELGENDTVGIIGFARTPRVLMNPTAGKVAATQLREIAGNIPPEGGTNLENALEAAYAQNRSAARTGTQNTVLLLTDGAANLGDAKPENLAKIIEQNKKSGTGLNCYGVGFDNYNDTMLETLARAGNGRYAYLNNAEDAREDFAKKLAGALQVAAQNVKVQVEFNPARVGAYRLLGYEKHRLKKEDFRNNAVKAAEIGAAENGTAIYAYEPKPDGTGDVGVVRVRWQNPKTGEYLERDWAIPYDAATPAFERAPAGIRLGGSAAIFSEYLQGAESAGGVELPALAEEIAGANRVLWNFPENRKLQQMIQDAVRLEK